MAVDVSVMIGGVWLYQVAISQVKPVPVGNGCGDN